MTSRLEQAVSRVALTIAVVASLAAAIKVFMPRRAPLTVETRAVMALGDTAMLIGSARAARTIILATDHACPFCRQLRDSLSWAMAQDSLRFNVRIIPFPLTSLHPTAETSARILVCAARLGRQQIADSVLFDLGADVVDIPLQDVARKIGIERGLDTFGACVRSDAVADYVRFASTTVAEAGATATPTMWVDGVRITGLMPVDSILQRR